MKLICFGDLCVDIVGKTVMGDGADSTLTDLSFRAGGAALNCAIAADQAGARVDLLGLLGDDSLSELIRSRLSETTVQTANVRTVRVRTGTTISLVNGKGANQFYSYRGANAETYPHLNNVNLGTDDWLSLSGYSFQDSESRTTAETLLASGAKYAIDPSFQFARDFAARYATTIRNAQLLLPNLEEARCMTGHDSPERCADALRDQGPKMVVVKLGADGCYVSSDDFRGFVPLPRAVTVQDTTGAGDAFAGTFLASLLQGRSILEAAQEGNSVASSLVQSERWKSI